jgi:hypothetical protein
MTQPLVCDGCGQPASPEHIARRLERLELTTRYRPVHVASLLLAAVSPKDEPDFLYAGKFAGEAARVLECVGIGTNGKTAEGVLAEFQRAGYFLAHALECPLDAAEASDAGRAALLRARAAAVAARIRRSLRPKRAVLISEQLAPLLAELSSSELGCPVVLDNGKPFAIEGLEQSGSLARLREALIGAAVAR